MNKQAKFFVTAITRRGVVLGYGVNDIVGGIESEHARYDVTPDQSAEVALHLANTHRDDLNSAIA